MFNLKELPKELIPSDPRFGCGPSLIPMQYVEGLLKAGPHLLGTSHRKAPVKNLCRETQDGLKSYFNLPDDYTVVLGNGGATFLFDMIGLGAVEKKVSHFTCGEFSSKWFKADNIIPWIDADEIASEYGSGSELKNISDSDMICGTLNETSTGVQLANHLDVDDKTILAIDATSGGGQIPWAVNKTDMFFLSPQKVFASEGGFFVAILSPKAVERVLKIEKDKSRYIPDIMCWKRAIDNSLKNQTYNTPSVSTLYFLAEQVKHMNSLGYNEVIAQAEKKAELVYGWAKQKDYLSSFVKDDKYRSRSVATIDVDEKIDVSGILAELEKNKLVYGIDSYRKLGRNQFRISLFHNISFGDLERLTKLLSYIIEK